MPRGAALSGRSAWGLRCVEVSGPGCWLRVCPLCEISSTCTLMTCAVWDMYTTIKSYLKIKTTHTQNRGRAPPGMEVSPWCQMRKVPRQCTSVCLKIFIEMYYVLTRDSFGRRLYGCTTSCRAQRMHRHLGSCALSG